MTKISQFTDGPINADVRLLGTDTDGGNATKNYLLSDIVKSDVFLPSVINFFDNTSASITTALEDVWTPLLCETTEGIKRNGLSLVEELTLTSTKVLYDNSVPKQFKFSALVSLSDAATRIIHIAMFKNGSLIPCSEFVDTIAPSGIEITIASQCTVPLAQGDIIEVYIKCSSAALSATLGNVNVIIEQF